MRCVVDWWLVLVGWCLSIVVCGLLLCMVSNVLAIAARCLFLAAGNNLVNGVLVVGCFCVLNVDCCVLTVLFFAVCWLLWFAV